jgi:hypothetical protein
LANVAVFAEKETKNHRTEKFTPSALAMNFSRTPDVRLLGK